VQNLKTIMFNQLEMKTRKWAEVDKVKQRFEDMFAGFENKLAKIEAKMEEEREKSKDSERIEKKPRESGKSKPSGRIEKKPKKKPKKTQKKLMFVDLTQTQEEFHYVDFSEKKKPEEDRIVTLYFLRNCTLHIAIFYRITFSIYISHAITLLCV
jgi:hypothetical protein